MPDHFWNQVQKEVRLNPFQISEMFELDFSERLTGTRTLSQEDKAFLKRLEEGIHQRSDGHYAMPLPLRDDTLSLGQTTSLLPSIGCTNLVKDLKMT